MMSVALTGNVASGKTTVARIWAGQGVPVVMADDLARRAVEPGTRGLEQVVEAFGRGVLTEDGRLDRSALRERVFRDPAERARLEGILHPRIRDLRAEWMAEQQGRGFSMVVAEIPLLFEAGLEGEFDVVVLVDAPQRERRRRLEEDRGLDREEALRIMESQMSSEKTRPRADYVLENGGEVEDLEVRSLALLDLLRARARRSRVGA